MINSAVPFYNFRKTLSQVSFAVLVFIAVVSDKSIVNAADAGTPDHPVKGQIHGKTFTYEIGEIKDGILKLRQGKDFFADMEITVFLFLKEGEIPAGKIYKVADDGPAFGVPHIDISWKEDSESLPKHESFMNRYVMYLEFGQENNKRLPGKINLRLPDKLKTYVVGTFEVDIKGLRLIGDKPDLTSDSFRTLEYVAQKHIEIKKPGQTIKVLNFRDGSLTQPHPSIKAQIGYIEMKYQIGNGSPLVIRFQFVKETDGWRVYRTLNKNQIYQAHPVEIPNPKDPSHKLFEYIVAKKVETDVQKQFQDKGIHNVQITYGYSPPVKMGEGKIKYTLDEDGKPIERVYLLRLTDDGWMIDRALEKNETVNYKMGTVDKN